MPACKGFRNTLLDTLCVNLQSKDNLSNQSTDSVIQKGRAAVIRLVIRIINREDEDFLNTQNCRIPSSESLMHYVQPHLL